MSDWIETLKSQQREQDERAIIRDRLRLHNAAIIAAKAPLFWDSLKHRISIDSEKLRRELKANPECHCAFLELSDTKFVLTATARLPYVKIEVEFSNAGRYISIVESRLYGPLASYRRVDARYLAIKVAENDELRFDCDDGSTYTSCEDISQRLISNVCRFGR